MHIVTCEKISKELKCFQLIYSHIFIYTIFLFLKIPFIYIILLMSQYILFYFNIHPGYGVCSISKSWSLVIIYT